MRTGVTLVALYRVREDRVEDFTQWWETVVVPATVGEFAGLMGRWEVLRGRTAAAGAVDFVFLFRGGDPEEWDVQRPLEAAYGAERAEREVERLIAMLIDDGDAPGSALVGPLVPSGIGQA